MEPVSAPRVAEVRLALRDLVRVVRERVVDAAAVDVEVLAEVLDADAAALDVPARVAHAPRGIPLELLVFELRLREPEHEVALVALVLVLLHAVAHADGEAFLLHVAEHVVRLELRGIEVDVAARDVGEALFNQLFDHLDERVDAACGRHDDLGLFDAELLAVGKERVGVEPRDLHDGLVLAAGALEHLVLAGVGVARKVADVRDVHRARHVVAEVAQRLFEHVLHDVGAQVADVGEVVNGRAAGVHFDLAGLVRDEFLFFLGACVVKLHGRYRVLSL